MACHIRSRGRTDRKRVNRSLEVDGNAKAMGRPDELLFEFLNLGLNYDSTVLRPRILSGDQAGVAPMESTAAVARCRDKCSAQEGQDRVRELSRHLTRSTRG